MPESIGRPGARFEDPLALIPRVMAKFYSLWISATYPFASKGHGLYIQYPCLMSRRIAHRIKLGNNVTIRKDAWINVLPEASGDLNLVIEDNCCVAARNLISARNHIHLERDVILAPSVLIMDHNHEFADVSRAIREQGTTDGGTVRIGQGCWIGHGAAIIAGKGELNLGRNCVVAANAVVTRSFPPYSVISGNPARVVKQFDPVHGVWVLGATTRTSEVELVK
jgi:acetyltransferase-like isoleucine patch superfamily enzyme